MDITVRPRTMAEMLPEIRGILTMNSVQTLTAKKQPRPPKPATLTAEKTLKPMTIAQMRGELKALKIKSPKRLPQEATSTKKKWNSSVKVEKKLVSYTAEGQMKHSKVKKVLDFQQPKPKIPRMTITNPRITVSSETPKFPKPEVKTKMPLRLQGNAARISGICHIPDTPISKRPQARMTIANKENFSYIKKNALTPKSSLRKRIMASRIPETPLSNVSWKSSCDASFLQNEKEIELYEDKSKALIEEHTLENIAEVSPPASTPFKEYRSINEFFNNSSDVMDNSSADYHDNTIMSFDKTSIIKENSKREESVIVSLCDMLEKATMSNLSTKKTCTELDDLLEFEKQTVNHLKMIENGIATLKSLEESQLKSLKHVRKLISLRKKETSPESNDDKTVNETKNISKTEVAVTLERSPMSGKVCSDIKSCLRSPSYKIPKKSILCTKKKIYCKSMPNVSDVKMTPPKAMGDRAFSMYMKMKENMDFLATPVVKQSIMAIPNTPAITSNNLQLQLERLYGES